MNFKRFFFTKERQNLYLRSRGLFSFECHIMLKKMSSGGKPICSNMTSAPKSFLYALISLNVVTHLSLAHLLFLGGNEPKNGWPIMGFEFPAKNIGGK